VRVSIIELIANLGGRADVDSAPGAGTTVVIRWPSDDAGTAAQAAVPAESETVP
jgi:hypothetical protein